MLLDLLALSSEKVTALIGGGGKTTLLWRLAACCAEQGERVLVTTSTHILPPLAGQCSRVVQPGPLVRQAAQQPGITAALSKGPGGKCTGLPAASFPDARAWTDRLLYEADGARRLPLKVHAAHEPALCPGTDAVLFLMGLSALGRPLAEVCHRFALVPAFAAAPERPVTPEDCLLLAQRSFAAAGCPPHFGVILTQADLASAQQAQAALGLLRGAGFRTTALALKPYA